MGNNLNRYISLKKTYNWPISAQEDAKYPKEIANLQRNTTLHPLRWLPLKINKHKKNKKENKNYWQGCGEIVRCLQNGAAIMKQCGFAKN